MTAVAPAATTDLVELKLALNRRNRKEKATPYPHTLDDNSVFINCGVALGAQRLWMREWGSGRAERYSFAGG